MCRIKAQILPDEFYLFSNFFPRLTSFLISFLILVRSQPQHLIKYILFYMNKIPAPAPAPTPAPHSFSNFLQPSGTAYII